MVGFASLVVSDFTYRTAADTSDLKAAVGNLTSLAAEAHRQADATQAQTKALQGQMDQMAVAQRPWIEVTSVDVLKIEIVDGWVFVWADVGIRNVGHLPAVDL